MKIRLLTAYTIIYVLVTVGFSFYWVSNFSKFTKYKGDEFIFFAEIIFIPTYFYFLLLQVTIKKISIAFIITIPLLISIATFVIGLFLLYLTRLSGIPKHYILIYGGLYTFLTLIAVLKFWRLPKNK